MFDAEDCNIDTSGLTDHINDCVDKLMTGEDTQLAALSSLNMSDENKSYGKQYEKGHRKCSEKYGKYGNCYENHLERCDEKYTESPLFLGKGFWRPKTAIWGEKY